MGRREPEYRQETMVVHAEPTYQTYTQPTVVQQQRVSYRQSRQTSPTREVIVERSPEVIVERQQPQVIVERQSNIRQSRQQAMTRQVGQHVSYREPQVVTSSNVIGQNERYVGEGNRVLVETRRFSPDRDSRPRVQVENTTDWARYSQENWRQH